MKAIITTAAIAMVFRQRQAAGVGHDTPDVRRTHDASKEDFKRARQWLSEKIAP